VGLVKERVQDLNALALECDYFYCPRMPETVEVEKHLSMETRERMQRFGQRLAALPAWNAVAIHELFKPFCAEEGIKMGQLGMPLRLLVCGTTQTPSVDAVLALIGQPEVLARLSHTLQLS
jgi:glutamyl-tRNA synthetase